MIQHKRGFCYANFILLLGLFFIGSASAKLAEQATTVKSGLAVVLGSTNADAALQLSQNKNLLIHVLVQDEAYLNAVRKDLAEGAIYGLVSAEHPVNWAELPYSSKMANLVIVENLDILKSKGLTLDEITRILVPGGLLTIGNASVNVSGSVADAVTLAKVSATLSSVSNNADWSVLQKAAAEGTDDWTHWNHGADGNALSNDTKVGPPTHLKWSSGNETIMDKSGTWPGWRISNGVAMYFHIDSRTEAGRDKVTMTARDANNGTKLWSRSDVHTRGGKRGNNIPFSADDKYLYTIPDYGEATVVIDIKTGVTVRTLTAAKPKAVSNSLAYELLAVDGKLVQISGTQIHVINPNTGEVLWSKEAGEGAMFFRGIASVKENKVFTILSKDINTNPGRWPTTHHHEEIVAYNLQTGAKEWSNSSLKTYELGQLIYYNGTLGLFGSKAIIGGDRGFIAMMNPANGDVYWKNQYGDIETKVPWHDSKMGGLSMAMRGDQAIVNYGPNVIFWDIKNGGYKFWRADINKTGEDGTKKVYGLHACVKGVLTTNYTTTGLGIWIDKSMNYDFLPLRRAGCAEPGFPANGMIYYSPATCGCIPEMNGGKGFVALGQEGTRVFPDDRLRMVPTETKEWKISGGVTSLSLKARPKVSAQSLSGSTILSDWPEFQTSAPMAKISTSNEVSSEGFTVKTTGSFLGVDIYENGNLQTQLFTGGRVTAKPVIRNGLAYVGAADGYLYAYDLKNKETKWKLMIAPYDQRVMISSQLESHWPVTEVKMDGDELSVKAGRHHALAGGVFYYGVNPESGEILWKKRSMLAEEGVYSNIERGLIMKEQVALNQLPEIAIDGGALSNREVEPVLHYDGGMITLSIAPGSPVEYEISVISVNGELMLGKKGQFSQSIEIPTRRLGMGKYFVVAKVSGKQVKKTLSLQNHRMNPYIR